MWQAITNWWAGGVEEKQPSVSFEDKMAYVTWLREDPASRFSLLPRDILVFCVAPYLSQWDYLITGQVLVPEKVAELPRKQKLLTQSAHIYLLKRKDMDLAKYDVRLSQWNHLIHPGQFTLVLGAVLEGQWLVLWTSQDNCVGRLTHQLEFWELRDDETLFFHTQLSLSEYQNKHQKAFMTLQSGKLYLTCARPHSHLRPAQCDFYLLDVLAPQLVRQPDLPLETIRDTEFTVHPTTGELFSVGGYDEKKILRFNRVTQRASSHPVNFREEDLTIIKHDYLKAQIYFDATGQLYLKANAIYRI